MREALKTFPNARSDGLGCSREKVERVLAKPTFVKGYMEISPLRASLTIYISGLTSVNGNDCTAVEKECSSGYNVGLKVNETSIYVKLGYSVISGSVKLKRADADTVQISLNVDIPPTQLECMKAMFFERRTPLSRDLSPLHSIECLRCGAAVFAAKDSKLVDLPSEHWFELMDHWLCHQNTRFASGMPQKALENRTERETLYIGETTVRFHAKDAVEGSVCEQLSQDLNQPSPDAYCSSCGEVLGYYQRVGFPDKSVVLYQSNVCFQMLPIQGHDATRKRVLKVKKASVLAQEIMSHVSAHGCFRFLLVSREDGVVHALLWNLGNNVFGYWDNFCESGLQELAWDATVARSNIKLQAMMNPDSAESGVSLDIFNETRDAWLSSDVFETTTLSYSKKDCLDIVSYLLKKSNAIPPLYRNLQKGWVATWL